MNVTVTNRELTKLPELRKERVDPLVTALNPAVAKAAKEWNELFARAVKVRGQATTKMQAVHKARTEDTQRLTQSYLDGKDGNPEDRKAEDKAFAEAEVAHREAEALTKAVNQKAAQLHHILRDNADAAKDKARATVTDEAKELIKVTEQAANLVARIAQMDGAIEAIEWSERDNVGSRFRNVTVKNHEVFRIVDQLTAFAEGKLQDSHEIA